MSEVLGLNQEAWERWIAYKKQLHRKFVPASEELAKKKLARFGDFQMQVVEQSIERGWTGLFELPKKQMAALEKAKTQGDKERRAIASLADEARGVGFRQPLPGEDSVLYGMLLERYKHLQWQRRAARSIEGHSS